MTSSTKKPSAAVQKLAAEAGISIEVAMAHDKFTSTKIAQALKSVKRDLGGLIDQQRTNVKVVKASPELGSDPAVRQEVVETSEKVKEAVQAANDTGDKLDQGIDVSPEEIADVRAKADEAEVAVQALEFTLEERFQILASHVRNMGRDHVDLVHRVDLIELDKELEPSIKSSFWENLMAGLASREPRPKVKSTKLMKERSFFSQMVRLAITGFVIGALLHIVLSWTPWASFSFGWMIVIGLFGALVAAAAFFLRERKTRAPMIVEHISPEEQTFDDERRTLTHV